MSGRGFLLVVLVLWAAAVYAADPQDAGESQATLDVAVREGLISLAAERVSLEKVLDELSRKTGAEFTVRAPAVSTDMLSVSFRDLPFPEAVAMVLQDYSYVIEGGESPSVIILASLASPRGPDGGGTASATASRESTVTRAEKSMPVAGAAAAASQTDSTPGNLDECQPLELREGGGEGMLTDAKVRRAQKVLDTQRCVHLWRDAIQKLRGIQDPRVVSMLENLAYGGPGKKIGLEAVEALWHYAADSQFTNVQAIEALRGLTRAEDSNVSVKAGQALKDYERYIRSANQ